MKILGAGVLAICVAACELGGDRKQVLPLPNTRTAATDGHVEQTKYADKVVTSNWTADHLANCVAVVGGHQAAIAALPAGTTVTTMRSRFAPYVEPEAFLAEKHRRLECDAPRGRIRVDFPDMGTFTVPAEALKPPVSQQP